MIKQVPTREMLFGKQAFLICRRAPIDEGTFLRRGGVKPNTYAGEILSSLYDGIFRRSLRLDEDYRKYYSLEYATFGEYLRKRLVPYGTRVDDVVGQFDLGNQILYFCAGYCFIDEEYGVDFLRKLLEPGGAE